MIYPMYSVRDVKTFFMPPQIAQNEEDAKRQFAMMINNGDSILGFAPKDFDLFYVGNFDSEKGEIVPVQPVVFVVAGTGVFNEK